MDLAGRNTEFSNVCQPFRIWRLRMKILIDKVGYLQTYFAGIGVVLLTLYVENRQPFRLHQPADNFLGNWVPTFLQVCVNTAVSIPFAIHVSPKEYEAITTSPTDVRARLKQGAE